MNWLAELLLGVPESRHWATADLVAFIYREIDERYRPAGRSGRRVNVHVSVVCFVFRGRIGSRMRQR